MIDEPPDVAANVAVPVELDDRSTVVVPATAGCPDASCRCTVIGPSVADNDAVPLTADDVIASFVAAPPLTWS